MGMLEPLTTSFNIAGSGFETLKKIQSSYERLQNVFKRTETQSSGVFKNMGKQATKFFKYVENGAVRVGNAFSKMAARSNLDFKSLNSRKSGSMVSKAVGLAAGIGLTFGISGAIQQYKQFDDTMLQSKAIVGATTEEYALLRKGATDLGRTTRFTAVQVAEAQKYQAIAGWRTNQILEATPAILNLAAAAGEDLARVSDIVTDSMSAFGWKAKEAAYFTDILTKAATSTNTTVGLMGESFKYVAPQASTLKESVQDTATYLGILANNGIKGSMAGTSLNEVFSSLINTSAKADKLLKGLGIKTKDANGDFRGLMTILPELQKSLEGFGTAERGAILGQIFGERGGRAINLLLKTSNKELMELRKTITDSEGAASRLAKTMNSGLGGAIDNAKSALEGFALDFVEYFQDDLIKGLNKFSNFLNELAPKIKNAFDRIKEFWGEHKDLIISLAGGFLAAKVAFGGFISVMAKVTVLKKAIVVLKGIGLALGLTTWQVALIVVGIAALTAGFIYLYRKTEWFPKFLSDVWEFTKFVTKAFIMLGEVFINSFIFPLKFGLPFLNEFLDFFPSFENVFKKVFEMIGKYALKIIELSFKPFKALKSLLKKFFGDTEWYQKLFGDGEFRVTTKEEKERNDKTGDRMLNNLMLNNKALAPKNDNVDFKRMERVTFNGEDRLKKNMVLNPQVKIQIPEEKPQDKEKQPEIKYVKEKIVTEKNDNSQHYYYFTVTGENPENTAKSIEEYLKEREIRRGEL